MLVECARPSRVRTIHIEGGIDSTLAADAPLATSLQLPLVGLVAGQTHSVKLTLEDDRGHTYQTPPQSVSTPALPADFPQIGPPQGRASKGFLLFSTALQPEPGAIPRKSFLVLCDVQGRVLWYLEADEMLGDAHLLAGKLWVQSLTRLNVRQLDWSGRELGGWQSIGLGREGGQGLTPVSTDTFHHDFSLDPEGNLWTLGTFLEDKKWVDDLILKVDPRGQVLTRWPLRSQLDPLRQVYHGEFNFWQVFYGPGVEAWGHANSLDIDHRRQRALVSLRIQDALVEVDLQNGKPQWILANPEGWRGPCRDLLLKPDGKLQWPARQHSARRTRSGSILLFDNGRGHSRAVEFAVDASHRRVRQIWEYQGEPYFSPLLGDARELPDHHVQITDGWHLGAKGHVSARILEVTRSQKAEKVWELSIDRPGSAGCNVYRCQRLEGLY